MLQGKCPKCGNEMTLPSNKNTVNCLYCGQEVSVADAAALVKHVDGSLMNEDEYLEEVEEACSLLPKMLIFENAEEHFQRDAYEAAFKEYYTEQYRTLMKVERAYTVALDKEGLIRQLVDAFMEGTNDAIGQIARKNEKTQLQLHDSFMMASYVVPAMAKYKGPAMDALQEELIKRWNARFPEPKIQKTSFEKVNSHFHKRLCYITTAVCESLSKEDDCYELKTLRNYRDTYLLSTPEGEQLVQEYYDVAPTIVKRINRLPEAKDIYQNVYHQFLEPCIEKIEQKDLDGCREIYQEMVYNLKEIYFDHMH